MNRSKILGSFFIIALLLQAQLVVAQLYMEKKTRHRFAQMYLGLNTQFVPASGQLFWNGQAAQFPQNVLPRISIGAKWISV